MSMIFIPAPLRFAKRGGNLCSNTVVPKKLRDQGGSDHNDRHIGSSRLGFGQEFKPSHSRHIDIRQDQDE
jgi:hypothetical protein